MLSRKYVEKYLFNGHFWKLEDVLYYIFTAGQYPDNLYLTKRIRSELTEIVNTIRMREKDSTEDIKKLIDDVLSERYNDPDI